MKLKRFLTLTTSLLILLSLISGCSTVSGNDDSDGKVKVVTTIFPQYDFVREIAGDSVSLTMLLPPGSESHSFEPTPQDMIKIQNCDIFIYVGGRSDSWAEKILESVDTSGITLITLMNLVEIRTEEIVEGMEDDHDPEHDHDEQEYDEHVWTSPENTKLIVQKISDALCEADTENAELFRRNTEEYLGKLDTLDAAFHDVVNNSARKTLVFGDRFPFRYFADAYGLNYFAAFPGCASDTEASAATIGFLIDKVKEEKIPVVFHIEFSNQKMVNTISEETGAKVMLFHSCHNVSRDDIAKGANYLDLMAQNVEALKEALK